MFIQFQFRKVFDFQKYQNIDLYIVPLYNFKVILLLFFWYPSINFILKFETNQLHDGYLRIKHHRRAIEIKTASIFLSLTITTYGKSIIDATMYVTRERVRERPKKLNIRREEGRTERDGEKEGGGEERRKYDKVYLLYNNTVHMSLLIMHLHIF